MVTVLTLGSVSFAPFEAPERLRLGGVQAAGVHKYAGGGIDLQPMGAFDSPISWSGTLRFQGALAKAAALKRMKDMGQEVTLRQGTISVRVLVTEFEIDYQNDALIPYSITCTPAELINMTANKAAVQPQPTLPVVTQTVTPPQLALTPAAVADPATKPSTFDTVALLGAAAVTAASTIIDLLSPTAGAATASTPRQVLHYVGAADTLWSIAAAYYGDGSRWPQIAEANGVRNAIGLAVGTALAIPNPSRTP